MNKYELRQTPLALAVGVVVAGASAHAGDDVQANIIVTTTEDAPIGVLGSECTLRAAVESAQTQSAVDGCKSGQGIINVIGFDTDLAESVITLSEGEIQIDDPDTLIIRGPVDGDPGGIAIDGGDNSRLFSIEGGVQVGMKYLTLTGGRIEGSTSTTYDGGGAVIARDTRLILDQVAITGNRTEGGSEYGGAIYADNVDLSIANADISHNSTHGNGSNGGALHLNASQVSIADSVVSNNSTERHFASGGAISSSSNSALTLARTRVENNRTTDVHSPGGGISAGGGGSVAIIDSMISGNSTIGDYSSGGGIAGRQSRITIERTTISSNTAQGQGSYGGGINSSLFPLHVFQSTISGNSSSGGGGGINKHHSELLIYHSTVAYNTSPVGSGGIGVEGDGDFQLLASLVVQGDAQQSGCSRQPDNYQNTLSTDAVCAGATTEAGRMALGPLADNGGRTKTHALSSGSVAIDAAGDCEDKLDISDDQRGLIRPGPGSKACDAGAFEFGHNRLFRDRFEARQDG